MLVTTLDSFRKRWCGFVQILLQTWLIAALYPEARENYQVSSRL
jgi:hypothetical protein